VTAERATEVDSQHTACSGSRSMRASSCSLHGCL